MSDYKFILEFKDIPDSPLLGETNRIKVINKVTEYLFKGEKKSKIKFDEKDEYILYKGVIIGRRDQLEGYTVIILQLGTSITTPHVFLNFNTSDIKQSIKEQEDYWRRRGVK